MGKRLLRIFQKDILSKIHDLLNKEVNIIFNNNHTLHGIIVKSENNTFTVNDMLRKKHEFDINTIAEIHIDKEAPF